MDDDRQGIKYTFFVKIVYLNCLFTTLLIHSFTLIKENKEIKIRAPRKVPPFTRGRPVSLDR